MEDKRQLANSELEATLNSGILSVVPQSQSNFESLPIAPQSDNISGQNIMNNFNVNVNVSGGGQSQMERAANQTMQRMLPNLVGSPEEIKKNSSLILVDNSSKTSEATETNNFEVVQQEVLLNNLTPNNYFEETTNQTNVYNQGPSIPLFDFARESMGSEDLVGKYTYTDSLLKKNNSKIARDYEILKNITYNSFSDQSTSTTVLPYSAYDNSLYVENVMGERTVQTLEKLSVENNTENNLEIADHISRERERYHRSENDLIADITRNSRNSQQLSELSQTDIAEAASVTPKEGVGSPEINRSRQESATNINGSLKDRPVFITKMSSPPKWRTALG